MAAVSPEKLARIIERFASVEHALASGAGGETFVRLSKDYAELEPTAKAAMQLKSYYEELSGLRELLAAGGEMAGMAEAEKPVLVEKIEQLEKHLRILLLPKDAADERNVILEVRAGTGGDEAAIFAGD